MSLETNAFTPLLVPCGRNSELLFGVRFDPDASAATFGLGEQGQLGDRCTRRAHRQSVLFE